MGPSQRELRAVFIGMVHPTDPAFDLQIVRRGIPPKALKRRNEKVSKHRRSKGPLSLGEVKPGKSGYEIFARFVAIVLVGALPAGTPPIVLACLDFDAVRLLLRNHGLGHHTLPSGSIL